MPDYLYYNVYFDTDTKPMTFYRRYLFGLRRRYDRHSIPIRRQRVLLRSRQHTPILRKVENYDRVGVQVLHKIDNNVSRSEIVWAKIQQQRYSA